MTLTLVTVGQNAAALRAQIQGSAVLLSLHPFLTSAQSKVIRNSLPRFSRIFRSLQIILKTILFLVLILNVRALPGGWHWRLFWPVTKVRLQYMAARTRSFWALLGRSGKARKEGMEMRMEKWLESITPVGAHPFEFETRYKSWVTLDESDFNMHMSNSSYPKVLDCARMKAAMELFPQFLRVGGIIPLASTHFHFIRELPVFAKYELRLSIGAWDEKWFYVVGRFVTQNKTSQGKALKDTSPRPATEVATPALTTLFHAPITENLETISNTPLPASQAGTNGTPSTATADQARRFDAAVSSRLASDFGGVEDGYILHTVCVSRVCFKLGRLTVPPAVLMATNGVSVHPWEISNSESASSSTQRYSPSKPPPTWTSESQALFSKSKGGSPRKLRDFYKGYWREVRASGDPNTYPWWERAVGVGGPVDEKRNERLEVCRKLVGGLDGVRAIC
ncbi:hypothetical protein J3R30DRAFT_3424595 [Lentinula aciculospora]|uniref:Thioesterase/thiol ester dehydrase-isomerase n=1 Tax=Lentinula aciculospora TaxID=153920 RepID=A0A9W9AUA6_9AGAR|nr:hypothetical protein J3R30DRAFT_3424595 [Lentinula aciculospora]